MKSNESKAPASSEPPQRDSASVTDLLNRLHDDSNSALSDLLPRIQADLRRIARAHLRRIPVRDLLQTTTLVDDSLLGTLEMKKVCWEDRNEFFAMAGTVMRRAMIDSLRQQNAKKRGGDERIQSLDNGVAGPRSEPEVNADHLALHQALKQLEQADTESCRIVELRYFLGMTNEETAAATGLSRATVARRWSSARLWLLRVLSGAPTPEAEPTSKGDETL